MTATLALSAAILKRRYARGVPKAQFSEFPVNAEIEKKEDWTGDDYALALQTESNQGFGTTIPDAQSAAAQGAYKRFLLSRLECFGVARIKGQALRAATMKGDGALVDLWSNELDGCEKTFLKQLEIYHFGTGNGVLGTIASGITGATVTLSTVEDVANFDVGMKVQLVSDTTLSPTIRSGNATITSINRSTGTLTITAGNWDAVFAGGANGDSIVRASTAAVGGANTVPAGWRQWLIGGTSPGMWKGQDRNEDPVRLASQVLDMTGLPMAEAIIDLESLITTQGHTPKKRLVGHPRDFRQVKKSQYGKVMIAGGGGTTTIGFDGVNWAGDGGSIGVLLSPFCPRTNVFLKHMDTYCLVSCGAAPMPLDFDKADMLRLATDDAYEARIGMYGETGEQMPVLSARGTNWGTAA